MITHTTEVRVRYADTDQMRIVHHARFLEYFEIGRSALIRSLGLPYSELENRGILLPVIEIFAKYKKPALYDDLLSVVAKVFELPKATLQIDYEIYKNAESDIIAEGYTIHSFLDSLTKKPVRPPRYFMEVLEKRMNESINSSDRG